MAGLYAITTTAQHIGVNEKYALPTVMIYVAFGITMQLRILFQGIKHNLKGLQ